MNSPLDLLASSAQLTNFKPASSAHFMSQKMSQINQLIWLTNVTNNAAKLVDTYRILDLNNVAGTCCHKYTNSLTQSSFIVKYRKSEATIVILHCQNFNCSLK